MQRLELPFWLITERKHVLNPPPNIPCADPDAAHAFTSAQKLAEFLKARDGGRWEINQAADREGVLIAVSELHQQGLASICIDPEPDGSGGLLVSLRDLLAAYGY